MPTYPIYVPLLPIAAQKVIGQVHESSKPALINLEAEGFKFHGMVDIFDAGPCVSCQRDDIRTVRESRVATIESLASSIDSPTHMIGITDGEFRAVIGPVENLSSDTIRISSDCAQALKISKGDRVRISPLKPGKPREEKICESD
jgi:arginine N-succinyltransferase